MGRNLPGLIARKLARIAAPYLSIDDAFAVSSHLLHSHGFGAGGAAIGEVGFERAAFDAVRSEQPALIDAGANIGDYTGAFLERFPSGSALMIEPAAKNLEILRRRYGEDARVRILECAIGDEESTALLYATTPGDGAGSLVQRRVENMQNHSELVQVRKLDNIIADTGVGHVALLKLDIEGFELKALKGAQKSIEQGRLPLIQFEFGGCNLDTHTNLRDFFEFFSGYRLHTLGPRGLVELEWYREALEVYHTTNVLAVARDG